MSASYGTQETKAQPVVQQPIASQEMSINPRNSLNKPDIAGEGREWSQDLCDCSSVGTCCLAWCLPCVVYGSNTQRLSYLERSGTPDPERGGVCNNDCFIYGCLLVCCNAGRFLQINSRAHIRSRYGIRGGGFSDCLTSMCCAPCALTQEEAEIELEENALIQQQSNSAQKA